MITLDQRIEKGSKMLDELYRTENREHCNCEFMVCWEDVCPFEKPDSKWCQANKLFSELCKEADGENNSA